MAKTITAINSIVNNRDRFCRFEIVMTEKFYDQMSWRMTDDDLAGEQKEVQRNVVVLCKTRGGTFWSESRKCHLSPESFSILVPEPLFLGKKPGRVNEPGGFLSIGHT